MVTGPTGPETMIDCADKDQQQFTRPTEPPTVFALILRTL
jgi:hypothetical protein